jgi:glucose-6-phosphate isomerase
MAHMLYEEYQHGRNIVEHFFFSKRFENIGKWYRQLLAESIGKVQKNGTSIGINPCTSIGTIDLHSVGQLDLAHTRDRSIHLIRVPTSSALILQDLPFSPLVKDIRGKSFQDIME